MNQLSMSDWQYLLLITLIIPMEAVRVHLKTFLFTRLYVYIFSLIDIYIIKCIYWSYALSLQKAQREI